MNYSAFLTSNGNVLIVPEKSISFFMSPTFKFLDIATPYQAEHLPTVCREIAFPHTARLPEPKKFTPILQMKFDSLGYDMYRTVFARTGSGEVEFRVVCYIDSVKTPYTDSFCHTSDGVYKNSFAGVGGLIATELLDCEDAPHGFYVGEVASDESGDAFRWIREEWSGERIDRLRHGFGYNPQRYTRINDVCERDAPTVEVVRHWLVSLPQDEKSAAWLRLARAINASPISVLYTPSRRRRRRTIGDLIQPCQPCNKLVY